MGADSRISWTDHTFNAWWGCTKIAHTEGSGCDHCYAETLSIRYGHRTLWGKQGDRRMFTDRHWREPLGWNRDAQAAGRPAFVFTNSMADVFEDRRDLDKPRARLFDLIADTPWLIWLLLTKRPEQLNRLAPPSWVNGWPPNAWAGTSVEHDAAAALRVPRLLAVPAPIHFLSAEPLLGRLRLGQWCGSTPDRLRWDGGGGWIAEYDPHPRVDWVITGGESGPGHRPLDLDHLRLLVANCRMMKVPVWVKQDSGPHSGRQGRIPDDLFIHERPEPLVPSHTDQLAGQL